MTVTREQIVNALHMYLDDYVTEDDNVTLEEFDNVKKNFDRIMTELREDCEEDTDEDDEE